MGARLSAALRVALAVGALSYGRVAAADEPAPVAVPRAPGEQPLARIYQPEFRSAEVLLDALRRLGASPAAVVPVAPYVDEGVGDKLRRVPSRLGVSGTSDAVARTWEALVRLDTPRPAVAVALTVAEVRSLSRRERGGHLSLDRSGAPPVPGGLFRGTAGAFEPESWLRAQLTGVMPFQGTSLGLGRIEAGDGVFEHVLRALAMREGAEMLARTTLVATEGEPCGLASLVKLPAALLVQGGANPQLGTTPLEAGLTLELTATHVGRDTAELELKVHLATAEPDPAPDAIPGAMVLRARKLLTRLVVRDGESQVLGGLFVRRHLGDRRGMPLLDELPALDVLYGSRGGIQEESELIFVLTPRLLGVGLPGAKEPGGQKPPEPSARCAAPATGAVGATAPAAPPGPASLPPNRAARFAGVR